MIIKVKVKPGSKNEEIIEGDIWKVNLKERAINGKANKKLIVLLSKRFRVKSSKIKIKNPKSRLKFVEIKNEV